MSTQLIVQPVEIVQPLILASPGFLATLDTVESQIAALTVTDAITAQTAADLQSRLTKAAKTLDDQRKALNKPFDDQITAINAAAKGPAGRITAAKDKVSRSLTAFLQAQAEAAKKAEADRKAELARLEAKAEEQRKAAAAAPIVQPEPAIASDDDWGSPEPVAAPAAVAATQAQAALVETQKAIAAVQHAPAVVVARPSGVTPRTKLIAIVEDLNKVPSMFVERAIKMRAIESTYCVRWKIGDPMPVCEGIRFEIETKTVSTGK